MKVKSFLLPIAAVFVFILFQGALAESCQLRTCQRGYANGCVSEAEAKELDMFCYNYSCGACAEFEYESDCYNKYATCEMSDSGCGWNTDPEFEKCVADAKERFIKDSQPASGRIIR